jgi:hypothetical protein
MTSENRHANVCDTTCQLVRVTFCPSKTISYCYFIVESESFGPDCEACEPENVTANDDGGIDRLARHRRHIAELP